MHHRTILLAIAIGALAAACGRSTPPASPSTSETSAPTTSPTTAPSATTGAPAMTMEGRDFWSHIEAAGRSAEPEDRMTALRARLSALAPDRIIAFERRLHTLLSASYSWELWGACYLINGGCSDDGFEYFRAWLISQGEQVYTAALADPDSLASVAGLTEGVELEELLAVARDAYETRTGHELPDSAYGGLPAGPDLGAGWDFDDAVQMKRRYPRLFAKLGR